uniref:Uncharacterized protein n=1 Tax=uncultured Desulfobacterium sp. TaxID=201089 RepID=E1YJZ9_9BACT|nr:unknown protein [uncultured Desulfobacterium sp.]
MAGVFVPSDLNKTSVRSNNKNNLSRFYIFIHNNIIRLTFL